MWRPLILWMSRIWGKTGTLSIRIQQRRMDVMYLILQESIQNRKQQSYWPSWLWLSGMWGKVNGLMNVFASFPGRGMHYRWELYWPGWAGCALDSSSELLVWNSQPATGYLMNLLDGVLFCIFTSSKLRMPLKDISMKQKWMDKTYVICGL